MRYVKFSKAHEGCKVGDVVRFEAREDFEKALPFGVEVARVPGGAYVEVKRTEAVVVDDIAMLGK